MTTTSVPAVLPAHPSDPAPPRVRSRRYPGWADVVGTSVAGLWPVIITLATLRNPSRYNPAALYSGLGRPTFNALGTRPTTDPNIFATSYALGLRAASMLIHGHIAWWNPFEALGSPLIGEMQSAALFPFTPLLLLHDGALIFHLALEIVAGVSTYWLMREFRFNPIVAGAAGMLFATNGTFAWLGNAAFNPVCFVPLMLLGVERARRAAMDDKGGGWRWLAVGAALCLLAGFIETAALALIFIFVLAVQRGFVCNHAKLVAYVRKVLCGFVAGICIAAPLLIAFRDFLDLGNVGRSAGDAANGHLGFTYIAMWISPYLFGRIFENPFPAIHSLWGALGGYAGFALVALAVASLFGRRERGLRIVLFAWIVLSMAETLGVPVVHSVVESLPLINHIVVQRYLPATWELSLVVLAGFALRDLSTRSRAESVVAITTGVLTTMMVLLIGILLARPSVAGSETLSPSSFHLSELVVLFVAVGLVAAALAPSRVRVVCMALVVVVEAAVLFAVPLLAWPATITQDTGAQAFLEAHVDGSRFVSLGIPSPNYGSVIGVRQLDVVDIPVPRSLVRILATLDPYENPTTFIGVHAIAPGVPSTAKLFREHLGLYERLGVRYVVAPAHSHVFPVHSPVATLAYVGPVVKIWVLHGAQPIASAPACGIRTQGTDQLVANCTRQSVLVRTELWFPGWSATVNGTQVAVRSVNGFQAMTLPAGHDEVALTFLPPHVTGGFAAAALALVSLLVPWGLVADWRRRRRERRAAMLGLVTLGKRLSRSGQRAAGLSNPPTGAVEIPHGLDAPTSAVPIHVAVDGHETMAVEVVAAEDAGVEDPPTSAVAVLTSEVRSEDPPTLAVQIDPPDTRPRRRP